MLRRGRADWRSSLSLAGTFVMCAACEIFARPQYESVVDLCAITSYVLGMSQIASLIQKFGGVRGAARALGRPPSTVQHWKDVGLIPSHAQADVLEAARLLGLDVRPEDIIAAPVPKQEAAQ